MAKLYLTPEAKQFFAFIDSTESRNTDLIPSENCLESVNPGHYVAIKLIQQAAERDMEASK